MVRGVPVHLVSNVVNQETRLEDAVNTLKMNIQTMCATPDSNDKIIKENIHIAITREIADKPSIGEDMAEN